MPRSLCTTPEFAAIEMNTLADLAQVHLTLGNPAAALAATRRATRLHRAHDLAALQGMNPPLVWWRHSQALQANEQAAEAREALEMAYRFLQEGIGGLRDEGLRRNCLNKIEANREIVRAWIKDARRRRLLRERRAAHLAGEANLQEPFERLVDTGLRLNELRSADELHDFLIDEATELSGAERVLLVLETPEGLRLAGSLRAARRGRERPVATPSRRRCIETRRTRAASLTHARRARASSTSARASIAPLIAQRQLLGYLYADLDGAFGRLREADRDLLGMLAEPGRRGARQRAMVAGARTEGGAAHRGAAGLQCPARTARQRARDHQQHPGGNGRGAQFPGHHRARRRQAGQGLFEPTPWSSRWLDESAGLLHLPYGVERGRRLHVAPSKIADVMTGRRCHDILLSHRPLHWNNQADYKALELMVAEGTDMSRSGVAVPIFASDRLLGFVSVENMDREGAFGDTDVRLLSTVAASMGVALENARLLEETQRRAREAGASADVLAAISGSIADTAPVFETILDSCERLFAGKVAGFSLVGDDGLIHLEAYHGPGGARTLERVFPLRVGPESGSGAAIASRSIIHYPDVEGEGVPEPTRGHAGRSATRA